MLTCFIFEPNIVFFFFCINLVITPDVTELFVCKHWRVKVKKNGKLMGKKSIFTFNCPECLEWFYSLHQIAVCIYKIYFLFKSVYFWGKILISLWDWGFWDEGPYCPWSSGLTGGTGLEDHGQCAKVLFDLNSFFLLLLFIDRFIVLSFGMGLATKQGWLIVKERRLNEKLKYIK